MKPSVLFAINGKWYPELFSQLDLGRIADTCDVLNVPAPADADKAFLLAHCSGADIIVTSWDTASLDQDVIEKARRLKLVTHAAGTVRPVVSDALWDAGVRITSAAAAISYGVSEYCLGLILMATKRVFWIRDSIRQGKWQDSLSQFHGPSEIYQQQLGIIGAGFIGRRLIELLQSFTCDILVYDPYISDDDAEALVATKVETLEELFSQCMVVSLNAPTTDETINMLRGRHFALLPDGATFINTASGVVVNQAEMVEELRKERFVACIDRTDPEPLPADHPLRTLPNVMLSPHIAGVVAQNKLRIGTFVADEIEAFMGGGDLLHEVTKADLRMMA